MTTVTETRLYGQAVARSWDRLHPRLTRRAGWMGSADLPLIEGTVIRLDVAQLPSGAISKPVWLWWSGTGATPAQVDLLWQAFLRRFDIEHTFRLFKQALGWTCPKIRTPQPRTGGPGCSSPPTPSYAWPATSPRICVVPGKNRPHPNNFHRPVYAGVSTPPREDTMPRQRTGTLSTRPRTPTRPIQREANPALRRTHHDHGDQRENQHQETHEE